MGMEGGGGRGEGSDSIWRGEGQTVHGDGGRGEGSDSAWGWREGGGSENERKG